MDAFYLRAAIGQRFCIHHPPLGAVQGAVVHVHAFAEEMNKSRRMSAMQSRALAQAGFAVIQIDLHGCGDSSHDLADASWSAWLADVVLAAQWLLQRHPGAPLWLWGHRAGALLAAQAARSLDTVVNFLFWQAAASGKTLLQQFLRLRLAGEMSGNAPGPLMEGLRQQLAAGTPIDVAGYSLPPAIAAGLEESRLVPPDRPSRLVWLEVSSREGPGLLPASAPILAEWQGAGFTVDARVANGPAFWQTTEIEDAPALIAATVSALAQGAGA